MKPEYTSTSERLLSFMRGLRACAVASVMFSMSVLAADNSKGPIDDAGQASTRETPAGEREEDYAETPYTRYGEFNEDEDEAEITEFFQYGRFFGVSIGAGFHGVTGNRALLWKGGFPMVDFRVHYWFNFNFALQLQFFTANHDFVFTNDLAEVNVLHFGVWLKYYFDTRDMSSAITFAQPYLLVGGGEFRKTETSSDNPDDPDRDSTLGMGVGAGLEFMISHRKVYFDLQGQLRAVNFKDRLTRKYQDSGIPDLTGYFYSFTGSILFTW